MLFARIVLTATGLAMPTPGSVIEVRAEYGGLPMALGLFFLAAALQKVQLRTGLLVMVTALGGYASARIAAALIAAQLDPYNAAAIAYELTSASLALWALFYSAASRH
jgi:hypothetical protein